MLLVQKWPFFQLFFFGNIGQENVFYDMLERKNAFLGYKNKKFKKLKNGHFFKVVNPWFWSKNGHFSNFLFLGNIGQENVFYDILELKHAFRGYKNRKAKKSKNWLWVNPKMAIVPTFFFFFREYRLGKCFWRYARTKKRFSRLQKQEVEKVEKLTFLQTGQPMVLVQKWPFFRRFLFRQYRPGECCLQYSRTKKRYSRL